MQMNNNALQRTDTRKRVLRFARRNALLLFLLLTIIIIAVTEESFFTATNALTMLRQVAIAGIIVCGTCFVLISGTIDLSVGGNLTLSLCAWFSAGASNRLLLGNDCLRSDRHTMCHA